MAAAAGGRLQRSISAFSQYNGEKSRAEWYPAQESKNVTLQCKTKCSVFASSYW